MKTFQHAGKTFTAKAIMADAKKYRTRSEWSVASPVAYEAALMITEADAGMDPEEFFGRCTAHMKERNIIFGIP